MRDSIEGRLDVSQKQAMGVDFQFFHLLKYNIDGFSFFYCFTAECLKK